jgi:hypothetical protein
MKYPQPNQWKTMLFSFLLVFFYNQTFSQKTIKNNGDVGSPNRVPEEQSFDQEIFPLNFEFIYGDSIAARKNAYRIKDGYPVCPKINRIDNVVTNYGSILATNTVRLVSTPYTQFQVLCLGSPIQNITFETTGATGISNAGISGQNNLPEGVVATWASNKITISGTPSKAGLYSFKILLQGGSGTVYATGSMNILENAMASTASASPTICNNSTLTPITHTTIGAKGIGAAIGLPDGVQASWAANKITISGTPKKGGTYTYTVPLISLGCGSANATGTISVVSVGAASSEAKVCVNSPISEITHVSTSATGIANENVSGANKLPAGVKANWVNNKITISGTPTVGGTFTYSIPLKSNGCSSLNATGTITVTSVSSASSEAKVCVNSPITAITHVTTTATGILDNNVDGANKLPKGMKATWAGNKITISGTPKVGGTYNYSIPLISNGCNSLNAIGKITVASVDDASSSPKICVNSSLPEITHGALEATGILNANVDGANKLPAGVKASWVNNKIVITGTPKVGGVFDYSIPLTSNVCNSLKATGKITVISVSIASASPTVCLNSALTPVTHSTFGATSILNNNVNGANNLPAGVKATWASDKITISGTPTEVGTFTYKIPLISNGCNELSATGTITVKPTMKAIPVNPNQKLCVSTELTPITHETTGATGILYNGGSETNKLPKGVTATWANNKVTISGMPQVSGSFAYNIPLISNGCGATNATGVITVTDVNKALSQSTVPSVFLNTPMATVTQVTIGATGIGENLILPKGVTASWNANKITISGAPTQLGAFQYKIPLIGGCGSVIATGTINVNSNCQGDLKFNYKGKDVTYKLVERMYEQPGKGTKCWLDRNLGAQQVATASFDINSFGDLYQWGRRADGHEQRNSATTSIKSSVDNPYPKGNGLFITTSTTSVPLDWRSPANMNLWQGVSGINNPCPSGWRLPTESEFLAEMNSWGKSNPISEAIFSSLKLPKAGLRSNEGGQIIEQDGFYWTSSTDGSNPIALLFNLESLSLRASLPSSTGGSVRCIRN